MTPKQTGKPSKSIASVVVAIGALVASGMSARAFTLHHRLDGAFFAIFAVWMLGCFWVEGEKRGN